MDALKHVIEDIIDKECQSLCHQRNGFILWKTSPEEWKKFSLHNLKKELEQRAPFMFSMICTMSGQQINHACAAAAIALRGRENHLSAFAYYINSVLQYGGAKKAVFERLSRMGITTTHANAVRRPLGEWAGRALWAGSRLILRGRRQPPKPPELSSAVEASGP